MDTYNRTPNGRRDVNGNHVFKIKRLLDARRDWIRAHVPHADRGFVIEDLDLIVRHYDPDHNAGTGAYGRFMDIEMKWNSDYMPPGQRMTFELQHKLFRKADPLGDYYVGFYLINWPALPFSTDGPEQIDYDRRPHVNGMILSWDELEQWFAFKKFVPSLFDNGCRLDPFL